MKARQAVIVKPFATEVREVDLPAPAENQILVAAEVSAVSPGTELAVYTGTHQWLLDPNLPDWKFPFRSGYSAAGTVVAIGSKITGWKPGDRVQVMPDDYGRDPVAGELVRSSANEIAIRRSAPEVGEVVVHFPRAGFLVMRAS